jgi:hypothetical protein
LHEIDGGRVVSRPFGDQPEQFERRHVLGIAVEDAARQILCALEAPRVEMLDGKADVR